MTIGQAGFILASVVLAAALGALLLALSGLPLRLT